MITISEEPYDGPIAAALVQALLEDLNERYADDIAEDLPDAPTDDDYLAEVTPEMVRPPAGAFLVAWLDDAELTNGGRSTDDGGPPAPVRRVAGCGALKPLHDDPSIGEIKRMYTVPAARRRGISRALLVALEARAAELGYRHLQLETGLAQPEAVALYESHGWHRIEPYGFYKHSPLSVCFAKELDGSA